MLRKFILIFCLTCFGTKANAATLGDALKDVYQNNLDIQLEKSRLEQIKATKGDAIAEFLPEISAAYQRGRQKNNTLGIDRGELDKINDQNLKQITLVQPVFSGFKSYNNAKEIEYNIKSAEQYYTAEKNKILLESIEAYLNLYLSRENLILKENDERSATQLLTLIEERNILGEIGGAEVIRYQSFLSSTKSEKLTAKRDLFRAEEEYRRVIGKIDKNLSLPKMIKEKIPDDAKKIMDLAISKNPDIAYYRFRVKAAKSAQNKSKGEFAPRIDVTGSISEQENVTYLNGRDLRSENIYLNISVPIFQKGTEYFGLNKATKNLRFAEVEFETNKRNILQEVEQTRREFLFYDEILENQSELVKLTSEKIEKITEQIDIGEGDIIDLLESMIELNKIEAEELKNKTDYILSYFRLLVLIGKFNIAEV